MYDKNGNLLSMDQQGNVPGSGIQTIDQLRYNYEDDGESNRLLKVGDAMPDYGTGDFVNTNGADNDYAYDANGNLASDANKSIDTIIYTHFDKPQQIRFKNGKSIEYSYDAAGGKVQELVLQPSLASKTTDYISGYVYENNQLQYIPTAEGRSVRTTVNDDFKEEYFVKDHLGNVRSTVEVTLKPLKLYLATYELASANLEGLLFEQVAEIREDNPSSTDTGNLKSGKLNGAEQRIGTSLLMHVMADDEVELNVNTFYEGYEAQNDNPVSAANMLSSIIGTLTGGVGGFQGSEGHNPDMVQQLFTPENYLGIYDNITGNVTDPDRPKAYLNYVLFDENMAINSTFSSAFQARGNGTWEEIGTTAPLKIPANGYLAVYLSNSSQVTGCTSCGNVFFDQLQVKIQNGKLLEESHYYPFGLPMAGLSTETGSNTIRQRRKYQSNEYIKELGLNWMDFNARQYDPQLGRFLGVDPLAASGGQDRFSPYAAMGNAPESMVDPNGMQYDRHGGPNSDFKPNNPIDNSFAGGDGASGSGASGGSGATGDLFLGTNDISSFYGASAQAAWAGMTGQKLTQGEGSTVGNLTEKQQVPYGAGANSQNGGNAGSVDDDVCFNPNLITECFDLNTAAFSSILLNYDKINIQAQIDPWACGFACLSMLTQYYGGSFYAQVSLQVMQISRTGSSQGAEISMLLNDISYNFPEKIKYNNWKVNNTSSKTIQYMPLGGMSIITTKPGALGPDWPAHAMIPVEVNGVQNLNNGIFTGTTSIFIDPAYNGRKFTVRGDFWRGNDFINAQYNIRP